MTRPRMNSVREARQTASEREDSARDSEPEQVRDDLERELSETKKSESQLRKFIEARLRRYDGEYRWFLFRMEPLRDELEGHRDPCA